MNRTFVREALHNRAVPKFAFIDVVRDDDPMMKSDPYAVKEAEQSTAARAAKLAGTRMLMLEEYFDTLVALLIASGAVSKDEAAHALDRLSERLTAHATGRTDTGWAIDAPELIEQAGRLSVRAALLRDTV